MLKARQRKPAATRIAVESDGNGANAASLPPAWCDERHPGESSDQKQQGQQVRQRHQHTQGNGKPTSPRLKGHQDAHGQSNTEEKWVGAAHHLKWREEGEGGGGPGGQGGPAPVNQAVNPPAATAADPATATGVVRIPATG